MDYLFMWLSSLRLKSEYGDQDIQDCWNLPNISFVGPFEVGYVQTIYTVIEDEGSVEVCVELTKPKEDIGDEMVFVESLDFSRYIPADATLASELLRPIRFDDF